ncbi:small integral membrane protein 30-like [Monodon monoceros]|uniref:small integral membrane protein 30-like n=1 Tax=Monodon monoceros TaxID=40151 RepID=UPI0010F93B08|nr:small integral membrane protein 30-like [Monodon monoceros]
MISVSTQLFLVLFSLFLVLPVVEAVEAGDAIALLLGVVLSITGICACLGVYARKRNGRMRL